MSDLKTVLSDTAYRIVEPASQRGEVACAAFFDEEGTLITQAISSGDGDPGECETEAHNMARYALVGNGQGFTMSETTNGTTSTISLGFSSNLQRKEVSDEFLNLAERLTIDSPAE